MDFKFTHIQKKSKGFSTNMPSIGEELSTSKQGDNTVADLVSSDSDPPPLDDYFTKNNRTSIKQVKPRMSTRKNEDYISSQQFNSKLKIHNMKDKFEAFQ